MQKIDANSPVSQSMDISSERLKQLQSLFPEAFTEKNIDFDVLRQVLGASVEEKDEKFGLNWHGKRAARQSALSPSIGTLRPCIQESLNWESTGNLIIEGDNLEVLKLLQKSYHSQIKMIYIDPPYNTGNDFIYPDDFSESLSTYLEYTGQVDAEGRKFSTNTESNGRFHSKWLNMIYPRLFLARNLLREDGLIFISIDDNEVDNLRKVCNEIFGEENFVATIVWQKKTGGGAKTKGFITLHEYVLCFAKFKGPDFDVVTTLSEKTRAMYNKKDEYFEKLGPYATWPLDTTSMDDRPNLRFAITHEGEEIWPRKQWLWGKERVEKAQAERKLIFNKQKSGEWTVRFKGYLFEEDGEEKDGKPTTLSIGPYTQEGTKDFVEEMGDRSIFEFPKPVGFIKQLIDVKVKGQNQECESDIYLDFFAGSGTTAQAVLEMNQEDGEDRKFILVQLPEPTDRKDFTTIADISKQRVRNVIKHLEEGKPEPEDKQLKISAQDEKPVKNKVNLGFRVFKLASSNIRPWQPDGSDLAGSLLAAMEHLNSDRSESDILYELLLKLGLSLTVPIEEREIAGKKVSCVGSGTLFVCLSKMIEQDNVEALALGIVDWYKGLRPSGDSTCVFRDSAFGDDVAKTNMSSILQQYGLVNICSL